MGDNSDIFELDIPYLSISHEGHSGHNQISFVTTHQKLNHHHLFQDLKREAQPSTSLEDQRVLINSKAGESPMCYARNTGGTNFSAISQPLPVPEYTNCLNGQTDVVRYDGYTNQSSQNFNTVSQATRSFQNGLHSITDTTDILPSFKSSFIHQTSAIIDGISADLTNLESLPRKQSPPVSSTYPTTIVASYDKSSLAPPTTHCAVSENEIQSIINANISLLSTWQKQLEAMSTFYTKNIQPKAPAPITAAPATITNSSSIASTQHGLVSDHYSSVANDPYSIFNNISHLLGSGNESFDNGPTTTNFLDLFARMNNANLLPQPISNAIASQTGEILRNNTGELGSSLRVKPESPEIKRSSCCSDKRENPVPSGLAVCSFCGKAFKFKSNLHTHIKAVHKKIKPHTCPVCGKTFSLKQNMKTHAKNIHLRVTAQSPSPSTIEQEPTITLPNGYDRDENLFAANRVKLEQLQTSFPPASSYLERVSTVNSTNNTFSSLEDQYRNLLLSAAAAQVAIFGCPDPISNSAPQLFHNTYGGEKVALNDISPSLREQHVGMAIAAVANQTYVPPFCRAKKKPKMSSPCPVPKSMDIYQDFKLFPTENDTGADVKLFASTSSPFPSPPLKSTPADENSDLRSSGENTPRPVGAPRRNVTDSRDLIYCPQCPKTFTLKGNFNVHLKIVHEKVREFACPFCSKQFGLKANMYMHVANVHKLRGADHASPHNDYTNVSPASSSKRDRSLLKISQSLPGGDNSMSAGSLSDSQSITDPQFYKANDEDGKMANLVLGPENTDNMLAVASVYLQYLQQQQFNLDKGSVDNQNNQSTTQKSNSSSLHYDPSLLSPHNDGPNRENDHYHQDDDCRNDKYTAYGESGVQQSKHINDGKCGRLISSTLNTLHDRRTSAI